MFLSGSVVFRLYDLLVLCVVLFLLTYFLLMVLRVFEDVV